MPAAPPDPPADEAELLSRAHAIAGSRIVDICKPQGIEVPADLKRAKGFVGTMMEVSLGASAGTKSEPDFIELGIELKTIPVDRQGKPKESTFVCTISLRDIADIDWEQSAVWRKLRRVLFIPIEYDTSLPLAERRIGSPILWSPSIEEQRVLRADWELVSSMIDAGDLDRVTGHLGTALQVRPKAANNKARTHAPDGEGSLHEALPRGFYLRTSFTKAIVKAHMRR